MIFSKHSRALISRGRPSGVGMCRSMYSRVKVVRFSGSAVMSTSGKMSDYV